MGTQSRRWWRGDDVLLNAIARPTTVHRSEWGGAREEREDDGGEGLERETLGKLLFSFSREGEVIRLLSLG